MKVVQAAWLVFIALQAYQGYCDSSVSLVETEDRALGRKNYYYPATYNHYPSSKKGASYYAPYSHSHKETFPVHHGKHYNGWRRLEDVNDEVAEDRMLFKKKHHGKHHGYYGKNYYNTKYVSPKSYPVYTSSKKGHSTWGHGKYNGWRRLQDDETEEAESEDAEDRLLFKKKHHGKHHGYYGKNYYNTKYVSPKSYPVYTSSKKGHSSWNHGKYNGWRRLMGLRPIEESAVAA